MKGSRPQKYFHLKMCLIILMIYFHSLLIIGPRFCALNAISSYYLPTTHDLLINHRLCCVYIYLRRGDRCDSKIYYAWHVWLKFDNYMCASLLSLQIYIYWNANICATYFPICANRIIIYGTGIYVDLNLKPTLEL